MAVRPIIFSASMVNALLSGRKNMTRRVLKPQPSTAWAPPPLDRQDKRIVPHRPGDFLWVREGFSPIHFDAAGSHEVHYRADFTANVVRTIESGWRPSIHMPRWASRLTLRVTAVKVERLQEISEEDAEAEGCRWSDCHEGYTPCPAPADGRFYHGQWASRSFEMLWESLHGPGAWEANPWVACISFQTIHENVDRVLEREAA